MAEFYVYILLSEKSNKFYVGQTSLQPEERLAQHNSGHYDEKFTLSGIPWNLFYVIKCVSREQAIKIERHIKNMKSRKYIEDLKKFPEISEKLLVKYYSID